MTSIAVAGAAGRFGAVAAQLLDRGHRVRALTRDPASAAAERLRELGAQVMAADFDDPKGLGEAVRGVNAVFASGTAHRAGLAAEVRHGTHLAEAVAAAGAPHLVYVSGAGADRGTGLALLEGKRAVEAHIGSLGLPATILAPVYLMENLLNPWNRPELTAGRFPSPVSADRVLHHVAARDVIAVAVRILEQPARFAGRRLEIAGDALTGRDAAMFVAAVSGRKLKFEHVTDGHPAAPSAGLLAVFDWLERIGFDTDIAALRNQVPGISLTSYRQWARSQDWPAILS